MDLKEFLDKNALPKEYRHIGSGEMLVSIKDLGLFFWEKGGKRFVENITDYMSGSFCDTSYLNFDGCVKLAKENNDLDVDAKDFLDCLACIGEEKVKELIKEVKQNE